MTFTISKADQVISFPPLGGMVYGVAPFGVTVSSPSNNVVLTSTTTAVCTVAATTVTILHAGQCDLTASAAETSAYNAAADVSRSFTVAKAAATVTWSPTLAITADDTLSFTPSALASTNGGPIGYSVDSAGTTGCTVNSLTAQVTYVTAGTCAIKATSAEMDDTSSGFTVATFTISRASQTITFGSLSSKNYGDAPFAISASTDAPGRLVTFTSLTPTVCSVTGASTVIGGATGGAVAIVGAGTCSIRASQPGDDVYAAAPVADRTFVVAQGTQAALRFTNSTSGVFDDTLTLVTAGGSGTGAVTYALVGGAGTALCSLNTTTGDLTFGTAAGGTGSCVVRATKASDGNYSSQSTADTTITVARAVQTVTFTSTVPANPLPGETYLVTASANSGNPVNLSVFIGGNCSISGSTAPATVTFVSAGPCFIFADASADTNYSLALEESQSMTVGALSQTITAPAIPDRAYGSASFSIASSASADSGLPVAYSSDDTAVCTISGSGVVTTLAVGSCVLRLTQAGNAQYAAASPVLRTFSVYAVAPSRPFIFSASPGDGAIAVAFSAPGFTGGAAVTAYRLIATPTGAGATVTDDSCAASPCTITGLVNGTEYTVTVAGINTAGVGLASGASQPLTPVTQAAAVGNLTAVPDATQISLAWTPLINAQLGGGAFVRYDIYYRPAAGSWPLVADDSLSAQGDDSIVLTGLTNGVSYAIKIVAVTTANSAEIDGNTAIVYEYAATVPDAPEALIALMWTADTEALVSWSAPLSDGGRPVTGYNVTTSAGIGCTPSPSTDDTCMLTGLPLGQTITISATATNAVGTSVAATASYTTPAAPVPPNPNPNPQPLPPAPPVPPGPQPVPSPPPGPGGTDGDEDGKPVATIPGANPGGDQFTVTGPNFGLTITAYNGSARVPLGEGPVLRS
ncbi:MAG: fibronectin type III domain-containing protein, partial [Ilumatobacteraceae bacterium]